MDSLEILAGVREDSWPSMESQKKIRKARLLANKT
jgi:hypothetical protein